MPKLKGKSPVPSEVQKYINDAIREVKKTFSDKIKDVSADLHAKLDGLERKIQLHNDIEISLKCEDFIREKMFIVGSLERAIQSQSEEVEGIQKYLNSNNTQYPQSTTFNCDLLENKIEKLQAEIATLKENDEWHTEEINSISEYADNINARVNELSSDLGTVESDIDDHKEQIRLMNEKLVKVERRLDDGEQYTRRESILIHGLKYVPLRCTEKQMIDYAVRKINQFCPSDFLISPSHIHTSHILAKKKRSRGLIIFVKFARRWIRNKVMEDFSEYYKNNHYGVRFTEHLCTQRMNLYKRAQEAFGRNNAWTEQGVVKVFFNGKSLSIRDEEQIDSLIQRTY